MLAVNGYRWLMLARDHGTAHRSRNATAPTDAYPSDHQHPCVIHASYQDCAPPPLHHSRASALIWNGWRDPRLSPQIAQGIGKPSRQLQEQGMDLSDELKLAAVKAMQVAHP